ncbi:cytochrome aa3 quinol oxidase subunit II [Cytobacillus firmus]|uniref:Quinol oxidase polypeptide II n=1 Tax=Cytobacillus firmus TaxID=1399 RepID=A0AA46Q6D5_CYTFI|nr:cytochrome aa3 quinol oxidase subunit II [Cytobacillus firmus]UYG98069.1 cytochrome aa3 quinol oxidase subunit II [Cytobacillus firmus]
MKVKWILLTIIFTISTVLTGCEPLMVLDPKGPQAQTTVNVIWISIITMAIVVLVVFALYTFYVVKASRRPDNYEPPYIKDNPIIESIIVGVPLLIIIFLTVVTVKSLYEVEATPKGYENEEPLIIYASSSNWKWHFSYPEENIETVNYLFLPTDRPIEFKLYSYGPISSFWIPQLGGQKYAMAHAVNTLHLAADVPGEYMGRNANFTGDGFAEQTFNVKAMPPEEYEQWVKEIKSTAKPLTKEKFNELLEPGHLGQLTFTGTHLGFAPPPDAHHTGGPSNKEKHSEESDKKDSAETDNNNGEH